MFIEMPNTLNNRIIKVTYYSSTNVKYTYYVILNTNLDNVDWLLTQNINNATKFNTNKYNFLNIINSITDYFKYNTIMFNMKMTLI